MSTIMSNTVTLPAKPSFEAPPELWHHYYEACVEIHRINTRRSVVTNALVQSAGHQPIQERQTTNLKKCGLCSRNFDSGNALHRHLQQAHPRGEERQAANKKRQAKRERYRKKRQDLQRIGELEAEIAMARINAEAELKVGFPKHKDHGLPLIRTLSTVPHDRAESELVTKYHYKSTQVFQTPPNDLAGFEPLFMEGFEETNYVYDTDNSVLAISSQRDGYSAKQVRFAEPGPQPTSEDFPAPVKQYRNIADWKENEVEAYRLQPHREHTVEEYPEFYGLTKDNAGNFQEQPSGFSSNGHGRRESIFSRTGDDQLFDSDNDLPSPDTNPHPDSEFEDALDEINDIPGFN